MWRRKFLRVLGGAAATWPLVAAAQQRPFPVIGILGSGSASSSEFAVTAFSHGLREAGYTEGQNVTFERRWADGRYDRMSAIAMDLVQQRVAVIVTFGGTPTAQAARASTSTIPIVFLLGTDPVAAGLVSSINRPGGNLTGVTTMTIGLAGKRLEIVNDLSPQARIVAFLVNRNSDATSSFVNEMRVAAGVLGKEIHAVDAQDDNELGPAFQAMTRLQAEALVVGGDQFHFSRRERIVTLASNHRIPAIYYSREYVKSGGLMSYGPNVADSYRQVGINTGRILNGTNPADLPVLQPSTFEFVINLKTAKVIGITVPPTLIARADEVIE